MDTVSTYTGWRNEVILTRELYNIMLRADEYVTEMFMAYAVNTRGSFLHYNDKQEITYRPSNRMDVSDAYADKGRVSGKAVRVLKAFLPSDINGRITDAAWEKFHNRFIAILTSYSKEIEVVKGEDIAKYYHHSSYSLLRYIPQLQGSCMRYDGCQPFLRLYTRNTDKVSLVIQKDSEDKLEARALLWQLDSGELFMDRIYGTDVAIAAFRQKAKDSGWLYRARNTYEYPSLFMIDGEEKQRRRTVTLKYLPPKLPYMDTFYVMSKSNKILANSRTSLKQSQDLYELRRTDGTAVAIRQQHTPFVY